MNVTAIMQQILDETLLPFGVLSNHLRRVEAGEIESRSTATSTSFIKSYQIARKHTATAKQRRAACTST